MSQSFTITTNDKQSEIPTCRTHIQFVTFVFQEIRRKYVNSTENSSSWCQTAFSSRESTALACELMVILMSVTMLVNLVYVLVVSLTTIDGVAMSRWAMA
eukprot:m.5835 g.5835  ORF g.5835 m.5835 type:complete len:100 (+) comp4730_c0_seq1:171-470(+)